MSSNFDELKGRAKEALGDVTGDEDLEREGKLDQVGVTVKEKAEELKDWVSEKVDEVKEKLKGD